MTLSGLSSISTAMAHMGGKWTILVTTVNAAPDRNQALCLLLAWRDIAT
jgi:hypothetical protein